MENKSTQPTDEIRDGVETMPEFVDISLETLPSSRSRADELLDEALMESFPASDPMACGRIA